MTFSDINLYSDSVTFHVGVMFEFDVYFSPLSSCTSACKTETNWKYLRHSCYVPCETVNTAKELVYDVFCGDDLIVLRCQLEIDVYI